MRDSHGSEDGILRSGLRRDRIGFPWAIVLAICAGLAVTAVVALKQGGRQPTLADDAGRAAPATPADAPGLARPAVSLAYGPLIDPAFTLGPAPVPFGHRPPLAAALQRPLRPPVAVALAPAPRREAARPEPPVPNLPDGEEALPDGEEAEDIAIAPAPPQRPPSVAFGAPVPMPRPAAPAAPSLAPPAPERPAIAASRAERRPRTAVAPTAPQQPDGRSFFERLFGGLQRPAQTTALAYAPADPGIAEPSVGRRLGLAFPGATPQPGVAVYNISARTIYLPNGEKLEAHSGLGSMMDNPRYAHVRMHGPTPPHVYNLTERERLFHGVRALRLNPVGGSRAIHGRAGLLAHTYLMGPRGDSNGCISIRDYDRFLQAYLRGEIRRLVVVAGG